MNRRHSQRGVALVITLVMLSVVTFMAVVFLGVSRRERTSVKVTEDRTTARLMADAALARAQAEVIGGIFAASNRFNYDFKVSTNFINYDGFRAANGDRYTNVSYNYPNGNFVTGDDLLQNLANLYLDPRPPVFVPPVSDTGTEDFRFYLDLNRNGRFESNGYLPYIHTNGSFLTLNGNEVGTPTGNVQTNHYMGDPEWIGMLERPDRPHSASNRFVGRYAFVVQPAGKSLDLNYIHNSVRRQSGNIEAEDYYSRNQGFGSWELNLAGFLRQLNTNIWGANHYVYRAPEGLGRNEGLAFEDATALLGYRYQRNYATPQSFEDYFNNTPRINTLFEGDWVDGYGDGPFRLTLGYTNYLDDVRIPWPGSDSTNFYFDPQQLFTLSSYSTPFGRFTDNRLRYAMAMNPGNEGTEDRYTFYRLMSQMGMESRPGWENKINLNYKNVDDSGNIVPHLATNFTPWEPITFFTNTAHRLLRAYMTNVVNNNGQTNFFLGGTGVRGNFGITNIEISNGNGVTNNDYSSAVHRLLQLSANIFDATTNRVTTASQNSFPTNMPSVFRPIYRKGNADGTDINRMYIAGYQEVTNNLSILDPASRWFDITTNLTGIADGINENINILGVPWIIGAREGYPNFNELELQTVVQVVRKLQLIKSSATAAGATLTNQMFIIGISNKLGMEAWNSYNDYGRRLEMRATNYFSLTLSNRTQLLRQVNLEVPFSTNMAAGDWKSNTFIIPIQTNLVALPDSVLRANSGLQPLEPAVFSRLSDSPLSSQNGAPQPRLDMWITNRITYILIDRDNNRVVDYVSLNNQTIYVDLIEQLRGNASTLTQLPSAVGQMWLTTPAPGSTIEQGIINQIQASLGNIPISQQDWNYYNYQSQDKNRSIDRLRVFMGFSPNNGYSEESMRNELGNSTSIETGFNPPRKLIFTYNWQVNDPLVHYTAADFKLVTNVFQASRLGGFTNSSIGYLNESYSPWGGYPLSGAAPSQSRDPLDVRQQDPLIYNSSDWDFPTNKFPNIGWLGRVHRGTPWQTVYFKSASAVFTNASMGAISAKDWREWAGSSDTHPTNDWLLMELFTVAPNENASRGLLSVNQSQPAAWAAVLSGVQVVTNIPSAPILSKTTPQRYEEDFIEPGTEQFNQIWVGITNAQSRFRNDRFPYMGAILSVPELTINSPFLRTEGNYGKYSINDAAYERIPQQILSLLKEDEPRVVIYAYGQSLKPAPDSLERTPGPFFQICTNYQITGEVATKTIIRFEGPVENMRAVVESFNVLPAE